jgi:hypothetical protein
LEQFLLAETPRYQARSAGILRASLYGHRTVSQPAKKRHAKLKTVMEEDAYVEVE